MPKLLALLASGLLLALPMTVLAATPPAVQLGDAIAIRGVVVDGDLLVFTDLNLPTGWEDGDGGNPYPLGAALVRLIDASSTPDVVLQERASLVRFGPSLMAFYLDAGHAAPAWGSSDLVVSLLPNPTYFDAPLGEATAALDAASYLTTAWTTTGDDLLIDSPVDQDAVCNALEGLLVNVEDYLTPLPDLWATRSLVNNGALTSDGSQMVVDALNLAGYILSTCFTVGVTSTGVDFAPGAGVLDNTQQGTITATSFWTNRFVPFATSIHFSSASLLAVLLVFLAAGISWMVAFSLSASPAYASNIAAVMFFGGAFLAPWILQLAMIGIALLWISLASLVFSRMP